MFYYSIHAASRCDKIMANALYNTPQVEDSNVGPMYKLHM